MAVAVSAVGAVLATLLGVLVGSILSGRAQQRQWSRDRQADACTQVLRESSNLLFEFTKLIWEPAVVVADGVSVPTPLDWRPWNEALAVIDLVADFHIVEAAHEIDAQIWRAHQQVKRGWVPEGEWPTVRDPIEARRQDFVNIVRKRLSTAGPPLRRLTGRPPLDDPIWKFRRSPGRSGGGSEISSNGKSAIGTGETTPSKPSDPQSGGAASQRAPG